MSSFFGPALVIALGGIIAVCGAFWASMQQTQQEQKLNHKNEEITRLATENARLSEKIINSIEGGDSYPLVTYSHYKPYLEASSRPYSLLQGQVIAVGDFPIECLGGRQQNHTAYVAEQAKFKDKKSITNADYAQIMGAGSMPAIPPGRIIPDDDPFKPHGMIIPDFAIIPHGATEWEFTAEIKCRNGKFLQSTRLHHIPMDDKSLYPYGVWTVTDIMVKQEDGNDYIVRREFRPEADKKDE